MMDEKSCWDRQTQLLVWKGSLREVGSRVTLLLFLFSIILSSLDCVAPLLLPNVILMDLIPGWVSLENSLDWNARLNFEPKSVLILLLCAINTLLPTLENLKFWNLFMSWVLPHWESPTTTIEISNFSDILWEFSRKCSPGVFIQSFNGFLWCHYNPIATLPWSPIMKSFISLLQYEHCTMELLWGWHRRTAVVNTAAHRWTLTTGPVIILRGSDQCSLRHTHTCDTEPSEPECG